MIRALRRVPLAIRVPAVVAVLMVLAGLVASQQVLAELKRGQEARLREIVRLHVDGLSVALGPSVLRKDVWEIYDTLDRASRAADHQRMVLTVVADGGGRILAASDPRRAPVDGDLGALAGVSAARAVDAIALDTGAEALRVMTPLLYQGRNVGSILTVLDVADLVRDRRRTVRALLAFNAAVTLTLALVGYVTIRRMMRPVAILARHMGAVGAEPAPIPDAQLPAGDTEMGRLFGTYNRMTGAIRARADAERRLFERERLVSLGRLSSSLAHEINNPLGGLLNAADTIRAYPDRPDIVRTSVELLFRGLNHMRDVAKAILDHNRLDRTGTALTTEDFEDLRLLISPELQRQAQRLDWSVEATAEDLAPYPAAPVRQAVLNLLLNASTAAGHGGCVCLSASAPDGMLKIDVSDDGPGLPDAALGRLLDGHGAGAGGGVGLGVVHDVIAELGGWIEHARSGGRTVIAVCLPPGPPQGGA
ncbi:signal transduction histidine kinase [Rhodovulum iodosum]|uniref:histidine kinase n=1 Tax=Rhodovulum iodosum TaxID=68291 RepID=A0ABV3XSV1_9RHOB|nr:HAMP domain-containing sensor histidine kinase [Rhodovulum robiginosum]RSK30483.1 sensor histidine kinase [Rhodovulum robiginosum]